MKDLIVIGAGPGGYVAAIRAAQLGLSVTIVDKRGKAGGTCLNIGCIPSKALLHSSHLYHEAQKNFSHHGIQMTGLSLDLAKLMGQKDQVVDELTKGIDFLFKKNKIDFVSGEAQITGPNQVTVGKNILEAKNILIATGSVPTVPSTFAVDEETVVTSTGALSLKKVPKSLVVVGGGYIGLELGSVWQRLGAQVTVVEFFDQIASTMDSDMAQGLQKALQQQGMTFKFGTQVTAIEKHNKGAKLTLKAAKGDGPAETMSCDVVLLSMGRKPHTQGLGLEKFGITTDERGFIQVNHQWQTAVPHIYAIGDVIPGPMLAHKAEEEGVAVAEILAGQTGHVDMDIIPAVIYTQPEVASVGQTEQQLKAKAVAYKVGKFPFLANSRAKAIGDTQGLVKVLTDARTDRLLGVHIIGAMAGTMIAEAAAVMAFGGSAEDLARTCHAHPTHSEALKEAAWAAFDKPIHI